MNNQTVDVHLVQRAFCRATGLTARAVTPLHIQTNNAVFYADADDGQRYIFKAYESGDWPERGKTAYVYSLLDACGIPHARLTAVNRDKNEFEHGFMIEQCLPGASAESLPEREQPALYARLGALAARVHGIKPQNYGYLGDGAPALWTAQSEFFFDILSDGIDALAQGGVMTKDELRFLNDRLRARLATFDDLPPALCHGDLSGKNVLVYHNDVTLIDWDDAQSLCGLADAARLTLWLSLRKEKQLARACREAFLRGYCAPGTQNVFEQIEPLLHVWYALDCLQFFKDAQTRRVLMNLLYQTRAACGV